MPSVFICHASEDKIAFVEPLAHALREAHVEVWYDKFKLKVGDSLREKIDEGLATSDFGIVVLSPYFFAKRWTKRELNGLVAREMAAGGRKIVLPVWHEIDQAEILRHSPPLADIVAASSGEGVQAVVAGLLKTIRPTKSAFLVAKEQLDGLGFKTPSITDDCWLEWAELKHSMFSYSSSQYERWTFPLPYNGERNHFQVGSNIASAAMQLNWSYEAEKQNLSQLSHPELIHNFIRSNPGLFTTSRRCPGTLALYAPQLTLPEFDQDFDDVFDELLVPGNEEAYELPGYGGYGTIDGDEPTCGELIAWRDPGLANLTQRHLANSFVHAHTDNHSRYSHPPFMCLAWLLSDDAEWLPERVRSPLMAGFRTHGLWLDNRADLSNAFVDALFSKTARGFHLTRSIRKALGTLFDNAAQRVGINTPSSELLGRFVEMDYIGSWYLEQDRNTEARRGSNGRRS